MKLILIICLVIGTILWLFVSSLNQSEIIVLGDCKNHSVNSNNTNVLICFGRESYRPIYASFSPVYRTTILYGMDVYRDEEIKYSIEHENCHAEQLNKMKFFKFNYNAMFNKQMMEIECR